MIGDKVRHEVFGDGEIIYISPLVPFVEIALNKAFTDSTGRQRNTVIVPKDELERHE